MARILSVPERIRLFKEINRVHRETYGWGMLYHPVYGIVAYIDIERNSRGFKEWVPIDRSELVKYYFHDDKGRDITSLRGIFAWQAYHFNHVNPYKFDNDYRPTEARNFSDRRKLTEQDFISDSLGKRIRPDVSHSVKLLETPIAVQQSKRDGKIWISSNWLYHADCYSAFPSFANEVSEAIDEAAGGDKITFARLKEKYRKILEANRSEFKKELETYFKGGELKAKCWAGGYLFAASREWRIKTLDELNRALEAENEHFSATLEEFVKWLVSNGLNLGEKAEGTLRKGLRELYVAHPWIIAKSFGERLAEEDKVSPSDVYLWWGGEPEDFPCYAFLTLFFEIDPQDIGTSRFDEKVSRNLRTIINIAEKEYSCLSFYTEYEPSVLKAIFSKSD